MRQDLWVGRPTIAGQVNEGRLYEQAQRLLQLSPQTGIGELEPVVKQLRSAIVKKLGHGPMHIVIGVPVFFTTVHRRELRTLVSKQLGRDITVLATVRQPALSTIAFGLHTEVRKYQEFTVLVVDYNHASLDVSLATTERGVTDVVAHISLPLFGEDFLHLKLAYLSFDNEISPAEHKELRSRAQKFKLYNANEALADRDLLTGRSSNTTVIVLKHFDTIIESLSMFVHQHTRAIDDASPNDEIWKPAASNLSQILISGDASNRGFEQLRKAIATANGSMLAGLQDPGPEPGAPPPAWVSAEGAAKSVGERRIDGGDADGNWVVHNEL
ncbi:MAG: hypothetical protein Q9213_000889 [Squamulea squamosa]